jgi:hypothetical protein
VLLFAFMNESASLSLVEASQSKKFGTIHKLQSYFDEYDFCLRKFRDKPIRMLEIGISEGGSIAMWQEYFPNAQVIVGIDINPECMKYDKGKVKIFTGDQTDVELLRHISQEVGPFDIIIDDGGHTMRQNIVSFETLFPLLKDDGVYVIEDLHTSYWPEFNDFAQTGISFLKERIDDITFWARRHSRAGGMPWLKRKSCGVLRRIGLLESGQEKIEPENIYERSIRSIYFAESIAFVFKGRRQTTNTFRRY